MSRTAPATIHSPWDCKWSRFGRVHVSGPTAPAEGLWVCVYPDGTTRRTIDATECERCPNWEYDPPAAAKAEEPAAPALTTTDTERVDARACTRTERRLEIGVRITVLLLAAIFATTGFVVLTRPLAVPLTISLWLGAAVCFMLGIWGNFNRQSRPTRSW